MSDPIPDTGFFATSSLYPRSTQRATRDEQLPDLISQRIAFPPDHYPSTPNVAGGFSMLDLSYLAPAARANLVGHEIGKDGMEVGIETWDGGVMYGASAVWVEHKKGARECHFGQVDTMDIQSARRRRRDKERGRPRRQPLHRMLSAGPDSGINSTVEGHLANMVQNETEDEADDRKFDTTVTFPVTFKSTPTVLVWLNRLDLPTGPGTNFRLRASASEITKTTAKLSLETWGDGASINGAAMCWIVLPQSKKQVDCGTFGFDVFGSGNSKSGAVMRGHVTFKDGWFEREPKVLAALNMFDAKGDADLRVEVKVEEVTRDGFTWRLDTWEDSTLNAASASWIALGFH